MPYSDPSLGSNVSLLDNGETEERKYGDRYGRRSGQAKRTLLFVVSLCAVVFISLVIGFAGGHYFKITDKRATNESHNSAQVCQDPILRREWRSLSRSQKNDYIQAVKCLKTVPSQLQLNQTLYDDFAWVHKNVGEYSHDAAPFLAWHRYFIHTYEQKLQECGYQGHLTYWDWTLDWENITRSPVWDVQTGFGGSGNTSAGPPVFKAYCMTEGPFAHLEVPYFEHIYQPHCLLRGFDDHLEDYRVELQPKALMRLLLSPNYTALNLGLEHGPHISIPKSVNGDFSLHTAPYGTFISV